jgi:hypothetical protein
MVGNGRFASALPVHLMKGCKKSMWGENHLMPTVLMVLGWRLFFYTNKNDEPPHVHVRKAETECKFWLKPDLYEIEEVWSSNLTPRLRREVRKIIFTHFDLIMEEWEKTFGDR